VKYHLEDNKPPVDSGKNICEKLKKIDDDNHSESSLVTRHLAFENSINQVVNFYQPFGFEEKGLKSFEIIDGNRELDYVTQDILSYVNQLVELNEQKDQEIYDNQEEESYENDEENMSENALVNNLEEKKEEEKKEEEKYKILSINHIADEVAKKFRDTLFAIWCGGICDKNSKNRSILNRIRTQTYKIQFIFHFESPIKKPYKSGLLKKIIPITNMQDLLRTKLSVMQNYVKVYDMDSKKLINYPWTVTEK